MPIRNTDKKGNALRAAWQYYKHGTLGKTDADNSASDPSPSAFVCHRLLNFEQGAAAHNHSDKITAIRKRLLSLARDRHDMTRGLGEGAFGDKKLL